MFAVSPACDIWRPTPFLHWGFAPALQVLPFELSLSGAFGTPFVETGHNRRPGPDSCLLNPGRECGPIVARVVARIRERARRHGARSQHVRLAPCDHRRYLSKRFQRGRSQRSQRARENHDERADECATGNRPRIVLAAAEMFRDSNKCRIVRCPAGQAIGRTARSALCEISVQTLARRLDLLATEASVYSRSHADCTGEDAREMALVSESAIGRHDRQGLDSV
jgi:hypothetical protein